MSKFTIKNADLDVKVKGHDTGHIGSIIPSLIEFLRAIGYDSVVDVQVVMMSGELEATWSKKGYLGRK